MKGSYFTMNEVERLQVINTVIEKQRSAKEAAKMLNLSERQIWRIVKRIKDEGLSGIKHRSSFKTSHNAFSDDFIKNIIDLRNSKYYDTNFSHFKDLLLEIENIVISYSALYNLLKKHGFISKGKHKDRKTHRRRKRKQCAGDLVQADGTPFDWFDTGIQYSIHGFIDDATGNILGLYMCENECLLGYLESLRQMLTNHGIPKIIYPDKYSVFFPSKFQKVTIEEQLEGKLIPTTQFMNIVKTLGVHMFPASTSQAKGRIERLWRTIQDRLKVEFRLNNITNIDDANLFLIKYIKKHNKKFAVIPQSNESHFSAVPDYIDLNYLLTSHITRIIDNAGTFTIKNVRFQIINNNILPNVKVDIYISKKNGIIVKHNDSTYNVISFNDVPNSYSTQTMNNLYLQNNEFVMNFAKKLLSVDAKETEPLLVTS